MIKMVEIGHVKLKNHLWYLSERFVPLALFSARVADRDKKEMANAILKYQNQSRPECQQMPETEDFGAKLLKHFVKRTHEPLNWIAAWEGTGILNEQSLNKSGQLKNHTCRWRNSCAH